MKLGLTIGYSGPQMSVPVEHVQQVDVELEDAGPGCAPGAPGSKLAGP